MYWKKIHLYVDILQLKSDGEPTKNEVKHQTALFLWPRERSQRSFPPNVHFFFHHIFDASDWFIGIPSRIGYAYWTNNWRLYLSNNWFLGRPCANSIYFQKAGSKEVVALSGNGYDGRWTSSSVQSVFGMQRLSGCQLVATFLLLLHHGYYQCGMQHSGDQSSFNHLHCSWDSARRRSVNCYKVTAITLFCFFTISWFWFFGFCSLTECDLTSGYECILIINAAKAEGCTFFASAFFIFQTFFYYFSLRISNAGTWFDRLQYRQWLRSIKFSSRRGI